jgi:prepilin-type N-terminal cleavage/methylation domain-containing protein
MEERVKKGFTLVEVTVVLAVLGLMMAAISGVLISVQQGWQRQKDELDLIQNSRWAVEFMSNEVRQANSSTMQVTPDGRQLNFQLDPDGDGIAPYQETEYQINGTVLQRRIGQSGVWQTYQELANFIVDNPNSFIWSGATLSIELTTSSGNRSYVLRTLVRPRN